jgi:uncharacterized membrane protein
MPWYPIVALALGGILAGYYALREPRHSLRNASLCAALLVLAVLRAKGYLTGVLD